MINIVKLLTGDNKMMRAMRYFAQEWIDWKIIAIGVWVCIAVLLLFTFYITKINPSCWA